MRSGDDACEHHQPVVDPGVEERVELTVAGAKSVYGRERGEARGSGHARQLNPSDGEASPDVNRLVRGFCLSI